MKHPFKELIEAYRKFLCDEVEGKKLAALRIGLGLMLLSYILQYGWQLDWMFLPQGQVSIPNLFNTLGFYRTSLIRSATVTLSTVHLYYFLSILSSLCFTIGLFTRTSSVIVWVLYSTWVSLSRLGSGTNGGDEIVQCAVFGILVVGLSGYFSVSPSFDSWRQKRHSHSVPTSVPAWSLRIFQVQLCLIYFFAAAYKWTNTQWQDGTYMHYIFQYTGLTHFDISFLSDFPSVVLLATYLTMAFEISFPFLIWFLPARNLMLCLGVLLHLGIAVFLRVDRFSEVILSLYFSFGNFDFLVQVLTSIQKYWSTVFFWKDGFSIKEIESKQINFKKSA